MNTVLSPENQKLRKKLFIKGVAVVSADGFIAKESEPGSAWASENDHAHFKKILQEPALFVMGRKTFECTKSKDSHRKRVVFTNAQKYSEDKTHFISLKANPSDKDINNFLNLLHSLAAEYHGQVLVLGGGEIYTLFLNSFGYDAFDLSIETDILLAQGQKLFLTEDRPPESILINNLTPLRINLGKNTLLLQYR